MAGSTCSNSLRCMARFKPKKCMIILVCFLAFTCSIFFLLDPHPQKLERVLELNPQPLSSKFVELSSLNPEQTLTVSNFVKTTEQLIEEEDAEGTIDEERKFLIQELNGQALHQGISIKGQHSQQPVTTAHLHLQNSRKIHTFNKKSAKYVVIPNGGLTRDTRKIDNKQKHMLILGHYEQLGKTTINFFQAARLAFLTGRKIVKPYVRNSRFCGLPSGWTGVKRINTRAFFPLDLYYNISTMEKLFSPTQQLADMEYLDTFKRSCSYDNNKRKVAVVYFLYERRTTKQVLALSNNELGRIEKLLNNSLGWIDCSFINSHIKIDERIAGNIQVGMQYCVDPEKVVNIRQFEDGVLKNDPCVVLHQWRGIGEQRAHFNLTHLIPNEMYLRSLVPSDFVRAEVHRFKARFGSRFIGVHIRSERQLLWYGLRKFSKCMDLVYREVTKVKEANDIEHVFLSADIGPFGSDQISPNFNASEMRYIGNKYNWLVGKLGATTYSVVKPKHYVWTDTGLVAFVQLHILSHASHLVTLGSGTFQKWMTDTFKDRKLAIDDKSWSITRTCFSELKRLRTDDTTPKKQSRY